MSTTSTPNACATNDSLLDAIIKHLMLLRAHREDPVEREAVLLGAGDGLRVTHLHSLEIVIESYYDFAAFFEFESVGRSESVCECGCGVSV